MYHQKNSKYKQNEIHKSFSQKPCFVGTKKIKLLSQFCASLCIFCLALNGTIYISYFCKL